jgi:hypothetical protein
MGICIHKFKKYFWQNLVYPETRQDGKYSEHHSSVLWQVGESLRMYSLERLDCLQISTGLPGDKGNEYVLCFFW